MADLTQFWEDDKWMHKHYSELQKDFIGKWVAVFKKRVVAATDSPSKTREIAKKVTELPVPVIFVESGQNLY